LRESTKTTRRLTVARRILTECTRGSLSMGSERATEHSHGTTGRSLRDSGEMARKMASASGGLPKATFTKEGGC